MIVKLGTLLLRFILNIFSN